MSFVLDTNRYLSFLLLLTPQTSVAGYNQFWSWCVSLVVCLSSLLWVTLILLHLDLAVMLPEKGECIPFSDCKNFFFYWLVANQGSKWHKAKNCKELEKKQETTENSVRQRKKACWYVDMFYFKVKLLRNNEYLKNGWEHSTAERLPCSLAYH